MPREYRGDENSYLRRSPGNTRPDKVHMKSWEYPGVPGRKEVPGDGPGVPGGRELVLGAGNTRSNARECQAEDSPYWEGN